MRITDYPLVTSLDQDDVFIKDGSSGTKTIKFRDFINELEGFVSPTVTVTPIAGGKRVTITDRNESKTFDVMDGLSAYEIAVNNGFVGSEEAWLEWIVMANSIKNHVHGKAVSLNDSANYSIGNLRIIGNSTLNGEPSIDNPVEINGVGKFVSSGEHSGKYAVRVHSRGKNLFNKNDSSRDAIKNESSCSLWVGNMFPEDYDLQRVFPLGKKVTLSYDVECVRNPNTGLEQPVYQTTGDGARVGLGFIGMDNNIPCYPEWIYMNANDKFHKSVTFDVPNSLDGITFRIYCNRYKNGETAGFSEIVFSNIQVELGDTETVYEPYIGEDSEATLYLTDELQGIGNKRDEIVVNSDGTGTLIRRFRKYVFTGDEDWTKTIINNHTYFHSSSLPGSRYGNANRLYLCSHFEIGLYQDLVDNVGVSSHGSRVLYIKTWHQSDLEVKNWVRNLYHVDKTPLTIVYEIENPIETPLTQNEVQAILSIKTYKPNTTITVDGAEFETEYVCDTKNYIDRKYEELADAIVANGGNLNV